MKLCQNCKYGRQANISIGEATSPNNDHLKPNNAAVFICERPWTANKDYEAGTCSKFTEKGENLQCQKKENLNG